MTQDLVWLPLAEEVKNSCEGRVLLDIISSVATVTINRPDKLNAIDSRVLNGIRTALAGVEDNPLVRALILRGAGRAFSAGGDLGEVSALVDDKARFSAFLDHWHESLLMLQDSPVPSIAAVHGFAYAGGLELTQACDFLVLGRGALLGDQHANFGLFPAGGSTQRLRSPSHTARHLLMKMKDDPLQRKLRHMHAAIFIFYDQQLLYPKGFFVELYRWCDDGKGKFWCKLC